MIYFTSDQHFGHSNIIKHCDRPFASVKEMDNQLLDAINSKVKRTDTLYVLGDFSYRGRDPAYYRSLIRCGEVHLIVGNHDKRSRCRCFESVSDVSQVSIHGRRLWLSHYLHKTWPGSHKGSWHLYGHSHGSLDHLDLFTNTLDVGVDNCTRYGMEFGEPWSIEQVSEVLPRS